MQIALIFLDNILLENIVLQSLFLRLAFIDLITINPMAAKSATKNKMTISFIAIVKKPIKAIICFKKVIIKARITKTLPPIPVAFNKIDII